jgi:hypothetical protein
MADREATIVGYVAGTLSDVTAEAFEQHYFACDQCWGDVQRGVEIRAALTGESRPEATKPAATTGSRKPRMPWPGIATAASMVIVASIVGWSTDWFTAAPARDAGAGVGSPGPVPAVTPGTASAPDPSSSPTPVPAAPTRPRASDLPVFRSPGDSPLRPRAIREANGDVRVEFAELKTATRYLLDVLAADGTLVVRSESASPPIVVAATRLADRPPAERLFIQIEARNALGVVVATSARIDLPARD